MPLFDVNQYHTYADRFEIHADDPDEAYALLNAWYAEYDRVQYTPPMVQDPDVASVLPGSLWDWNGDVTTPPAKAWRLLRKRMSLQPLRWLLKAPSEPQTFNRGH